MFFLDLLKYFQFIHLIQKLLFKYLNSYFLIILIFFQYCKLFIHHVNSDFNSLFYNHQLIKITITTIINSSMETFNLLQYINQLKMDYLSFD